MCQHPFGECRGGWGKGREETVPGKVHTASHLVVLYQSIAEYTRERFSVIIQMGS